MAQPPKAYWPLTVGATNNKLDFNRGGVLAATIASATYYSTTTLAAAVQTALTAADGGTTWTVSASNTTGQFTILGTNAHTLLFSSGANVATSIHAALGFTGTDKGSATTHTSENQCTNAWYGDKLVRVFSPPLPNFLRGQTVALTGRGKTISFGSRTTRALGLSFLTPQKTWIDSESAGTVNQAIERLVTDGYGLFRWWVDQTANGTTPGAQPLTGLATADAAYYGDFFIDLGTAQDVPHNRFSSALARYSIDLKLRKYA